MSTRFKKSQYKYLVILITIISIEQFLFVNCGGGSFQTKSIVTNSTIYSNSNSSSSLPSSSGTANNSSNTGNASQSGSTGNSSSSNQSQTQQPLPTPPAQIYVANRFVTATARGGGNGLSVETAWTLDEAMRFAQAGNVVQVGPGVYSGNYSQDWRKPTFTPVNSGRPDAKIIFFAQYPAVHYALSNQEPANQPSALSQVRNNGVYDQILGDHLCPANTPSIYNADNGCGSSAIGCYNNNNIVWDGFYADERFIAWTGDGGPVASNNSIGCEFHRNFIKMREQLTHYEMASNGSLSIARTNHRGILIEQSQQTKIFDNIIEGEGYRTDDVNRIYNGEGGIVLYDSKNFEAANNIFRRLKHAFYPKGIHINANSPILPLVPGSFHHNLVEDVEIGHELNAAADPASLAPENDFFDMYQNVYFNVSRVINVRPVDVNQGPQQWRFINNTVYNNQTGFVLVSFNAFSSVAGMQVSYKNNILVGLSTAWELSSGDYTSSYGRADINFNRYFNVNSFFYTNINLDFAAWKAMGDGVSSNHPDAASTAGDPLFVDVNARNFRLQLSSPVLRGQSNAGYDVLNLQGEGTSARISLGAFISPSQNEIIGVRGP